MGCGLVSLDMLPAKGLSPLLNSAFARRPSQSA